MSRYVFKLPDLGEGTVEAEIVAWHVKPGDVVAEEDVIVEVMTDKASVEVPSPIAGRVLATTGAPGDMVPVGAELIAFETDAAAGASAAAGAGPSSAGAGASSAGASMAGANGGQVARASTAAAAAPTGSAGAAATRTGAGGTSADAARAGSGAASETSADGTRAGAGGTSAAPANVARASTTVASAARGGGTAASRSGGAAAAPAAAASAVGSADSGARAGNGAANGRGQGHAERAGRVATSPAIRRRAHEAGVDLTQLAGSGPNGRILRQDFEAFVSSRSGPKLVRSRPTELRLPTEPETEEIKVIGIRRVIAQRMSEAKRNIPHFAYVEEFDVTELESLRRHLNSKLESGTPALTYLPFIVSALVRALGDFPQCNALYDSERGVIIRHRSVHVGVATQTPEGLKVPVVRDAQSLGLWDLAAQMRRVTDAARTNKASRDELSGSTITVTSLGKLGGIASTPIINAPEVSIIGINRAVERPMVYEGAITIRRMMNLSSSFDHRFVDGHDAAAMIQALKERIEHPATIFID
ncbi:MAG TPA: dihydrolipoamide acetyltransferase family protein [Steroidobacteraceae bacterium]|nr:dihydrolipoamide acetyltransferase family protein [Steroidobacteraceae bacterium]